MMHAAPPPPAQSEKLGTVFTRELVHQRSLGCPLALATNPQRQGCAARVWPECSGQARAPSPAAARGGSGRRLGIGTRSGANAGLRPGRSHATAQQTPAAPWAPPWPGEV